MKLANIKSDGRRIRSSRSFHSGDIVIIIFHHVINNSLPPLNMIRMASVHYSAVSVSSMMEDNNVTHLKPLSDIKTIIMFSMDV